LAGEFSQVLREFLRFGRLTARQESDVDPEARKGLNHVPHVDQIVADELRFEDQRMHNGMPE
jgi:hypothetical protein